MKWTGRITTIGLSPAWDVSCRGRDLEWGEHLEIDEQVVRPAGKALNVSSALAWMGQASVATGLWGREDYEQMRQMVRSQGDLINVKMATVEGQTRRSITVVDTRRRREMHLRLGRSLATAESMPRVIGHLRRVIFPDDICVFAGAMPSGDLLESLIDLVETCRDQIACGVVDTYGPALKRFVDAELAWMIAPNVVELGELLGAPVKDTPAKLVTAVRPLLEKTPIVLVSRGKKGAVLITKKGAWAGRATASGKVLETVGCGDYLLAGFLASYTKSVNARNALSTALKVAAARARGWTETDTWSRTSRRIEAAVEPV